MTKSTYCALLLGIGSLFAMEARAENEITVSPAPGEVTELTEFVLSFDGEWSLENRSAKFTLTGPEGVELPKLYSYSNGANYIVYFEDDATVSAPGDYEFTVPAGKFAVGGVELPEFKFNYTIKSGGESGQFPTYSITPEPGNYDELSTFTITLNTDEPVAAYAGKMLLNGPTDSYAVKVAVEGAVVTITPIDSYGSSLTISAVGSYALNIGVGALKAGETANAEAIVAEYSIGGQTEAWNGQYSANPAAGEVEELSEVFITLEGVTTVTLSDNAGPADFPKVINTETQAATTCTAFASGNVLDISISKKITDPGTYRLLVPAAFYRVDGKETDVEISLAYEIKGSGETFLYTCYFIPDSSVKIAPDGTFTIVFEAENLKSVTNDEYAWGNSAPHITNDFGAYSPNLQIDALNSTSFELSHVYPFEESGVYTLVIPAGYFTLTNEAGETVKNFRIEHVFEVDMELGAVKALNDSEGEDNNVYDEKGILILRNATEAEIDALPTGIYITSGRKIRK